MTIRKELVVSLVAVLLLPVLCLCALHLWYRGQAKQAREDEFVRAARNAFHTMRQRELQVEDWADAAADAIVTNESLATLLRRDTALPGDGAPHVFTLGNARAPHADALAALVIVQRPRGVLADGLSDDEIKAVDANSDILFDLIERRLRSTERPRNAFSLAIADLGGLWSVRRLESQKTALLYRLNRATSLQPVVVTTSTGTGLAVWLDEGKLWPDPPEHIFYDWETQGVAHHLRDWFTRTGATLPDLDGRGGELLSLASGAEPFHLLAAASLDLPMTVGISSGGTGQLPKGAKLVAFIDDAHLYNGLERIDTVFVSALATAILVALLLAWRLSRGYQRSLATVAEGIDAMGRGEWRQVERRSRDALGHELVDTLNTAMQNAAQRTRAQELTTWSALMRTLAHEVNNTIAPIKSLAQSMAPRERNASLIEERAQSLADFVGRHAELARLAPPDRVDFDVGALVASATQSFTGLANERGVTLRVDAQAMRAQLDPAQIERVVLNLVKNAVEAAQHAVTVRAWADATSVHLQVEDDGAGVSPEARANLFVPSFSTKPGGHGLGLTLARQIVLAHGGDVQLDNRVNGGAVASALLPRMEKAALAA